MQLKAAKLAALLSRINSVATFLLMALLVLAPSAVRAEGTPQYSINGGGWIDYPDSGWQAVIDAYREHCKSGASKTTELVGGTSEEQGTIYLQNVDFDAAEQLAGRIRQNNDKTYLMLLRSADNLQYTTIRFDNCNFYNVGEKGCNSTIGTVDGLGMQVEFDSCNFYQSSNSQSGLGRAAYTFDWEGAKPVDLTLVNCTASCIGGGSGAGDLTIVDCKASVNFNGHVQEGNASKFKDSFGNPSICHIENLQPPPGSSWSTLTSWTTSFACYDVGNFASEAKVYRASGYGSIELDQDNGPNRYLLDTLAPSESLTTLNANWPSDWQAAGKGVYVTFTPSGITVALRNGDGASDEPSSVSATPGAAMPTLSSLPTRTGYTFQGYSREGWEVTLMTGEESDILTEGELKYAYTTKYDQNVTSHSTATSYTVNGVTFEPKMEQKKDSCEYVSFSPQMERGDDESGNADKTGGYAKLMNSKIRTGKNCTNLTVTVGNLVAGHSYLVQIVCHEGNTSDPTAKKYKRGLRVNGVDYDCNINTSPDVQYGRSFVLRFEATATTYSFVLEDMLEDMTDVDEHYIQINALQVRDLGEDYLLQYYNADGTSVDGVTYPAENGPTELFAQWAPVYTITFKANGGTNLDFTHEVALGGELPDATPATSPLSDIHFTGYYDINDVQWYDEAGKPLADRSPYALASDLTLYAHWDAKAYYKVGGDDGNNISSFEKSGGPENPTTPVGWALYEGGTPIVHTVSSGCDYYVQGSGADLRTPEDASSTVHAFAGDSLTIAHALFLRGNVSFTKLISNGGIICNGRNNQTITVSGAIEIPAGQTLELDVARANPTLNVAAKVTGGGTIRLMGEENPEDANGVYLLSGDFSDFTGNIGLYGKYPLNGCSLIFTADEFNGRLEGVPNTMTNVCFNYAALDPNKGLLIGKGDKEVILEADTLAPLKTTVTFYGSSDFGAANFRLMTFPAGTAVDPTQFTVSHATSTNDTKTAFENLYAIRNVDGSITLVANAQIVTLDDNGGAEGDGAVLLDNDGVPPASVSRPFRNGYSFRGYWTSQDDDSGSQIYDQTGARADNPPTLTAGQPIYAHWVFVETYYLAGHDMNAEPSFDGTPSGTENPSNGWAEEPGGKAVRHTVEPGHKYNTTNGGNRYSLFTPLQHDGEVHSFFGDELTVTATFGLLESVNVTNMIAKGASIYTWKDNYHYIVDGQIAIKDATILQLTGVGVNRTLEIKAKVTGGIYEQIHLHGQNNAKQSNLRFIISGDMSEFAGTWGKSDTEIAVPATIDFSGQFGGRIKCFPTNMVSVMVNHDGLPAACEATGLPITAADSAADVKSVQTNVTFYSEKAEFNARFFPLMTFPGKLKAEVDPAQFTVYHATSTNDEKTAFRNLGVRTNSDGTITLVANAVLSAIRENGPEIHIPNVDWIEGICSGEKTPEAYQAEFLTRNPSGVATWQAYVLGYEASGVATAAIVEETVQNANPETVTIRLVDLPTNPRTNDMVGVRYALLAARSTGDFAAGNAKVVVNLDDDPYEFWPVSTFEAPLRDLTDEEPVNYYQIKVRFFFNRPIYDNEVEWLRIESQDDDDYIDTGIKITHDMRIETKVEILKSRDQYSRFGFDDSIVKGMSVVGDEHGFTRIMFAGSPIAAYSQACFGFQSSGNVTKEGFVTVGNYLNTELVITGDYNRYTVNGTEYSTYQTHHDDDSEVSTMKLMAFGNGRYNVSTGEFDGKMWYFRIYKGDELIADFVPVKITTDDGGVEYAMYDKVGGMLHRNHGKGSFTGGPAVQ